MLSPVLPRVSSQVLQHTAIRRIAMPFLHGNLTRSAEEMNNEMI